MTNKDENINQDILNDEKEDKITLETEAIEQAEATDTETNSATETMENKDCGNLPQNQKDKKNKWLLLAIGIVTIIITGLLTTQFLSKDNEAKEDPIDYMQYVEGIEDLELTSSKEKYDYLSGITFDKEHINEVTVDDSQVDLTKAGEYQLTYLIDVKDEKAEDLKQVVTVKVVSDDKKEESKKDDDKKDNTSTSSKPNSDGSSTNDTTKPNNDGSSSSSNNTSKPSNSGSSSNSSSNNTNKKPTSPTHTHRFVAEYKDIQHEEKGHYETVTVSEAWDEPIYNEYAVDICNQCGADITNNSLEHRKQHLANGEAGGWHTEWKQEIVDTIHHPAKTEKKWIVDENGWTETVTIYKCSCGATK